MSTATSGDLQPGRLLALDVFRGATLVAMVLVNNAGDWGQTFAPLLHAEWHGWTPTDLIFPFFLFIVGAAIPYAFEKRLVASGRRALHGQIARRVVILFALGLFLTWFRFEPIDWSTVRIFGVLQRIALVYGLAALAYLHLSGRARAWLAALVLVGYWGALELIPVPGFGAGDFSALGNLAFHVDHLVLGAHIWKYSPGPGDPEGLLSTLPALVSALVGIAAAEWLRSARGLTERILGLFVVGNLSLAAGLAWHGWLPINKTLWTSSYVVFTGGFALVLLALTLTWVDVHGGRWGVRPLRVWGANSILAFVASTFVAKLLYLIRVPIGGGEEVGLGSWLYERSFSLWLPPYWASLGWALAYVALWHGVLTLLDRRKIFLKI